MISDLLDFLVVAGEEDSASNDLSPAANNVKSSEGEHAFFDFNVENYKGFLLKSKKAQISFFKLGEWQFTETEKSGGPLFVCVFGS